MAKKNKWQQPSNPPPPLFTGKKERDLVKKINDEIIERVIGQTVVYYPISLEHTNFHPLYGEAINKTFLPPVRVHALVQWQGIESTNTNIGIDKRSSIDVFFHKRRLVEDQDLFVREGDFVLYGTFLYEILSLNEPKEIFGQVDHKMEILAKCKRARRGFLMPHDDKYRELPPEPASLKYPNDLKELSFAPSTLETIDYSIYDYMNKDINFSVTTNKGFEKVPIIWVASERAYQIKNKKELRDDEGAIIMPVITLERTSVVKDLNTRGAYYGDQFINRDEKGGGLVIARRIQQKKTSEFNNADQNRKYPTSSPSTAPKFIRRSDKKKVVYETISIPPIVYVDVTYKVTLRTEYQQQMNELMQVFATRPGTINHLMFKRDTHKYEAFVQGNFAQANNISTMDNEERKFETSIDIKVLGYLVGEGANDDRPRFSIRENAVEVKIPRERTVFGDIPEYGGDGKLRGKNPYSSDRTGYIE